MQADFPPVIFLYAYILMYSYGKEMGKIKKILLSMLAAAFITVIIPLAIVELAQPENNADSTAPQPPETVEETPAPI